MDRLVKTWESQPRASVLAGLEAASGILTSGKLVELAKTRGGQAGLAGDLDSEAGRRAFWARRHHMPAVPRGGGNVAPRGRQGGTNVVNTCSSCANSDRTSSHIGVTRIGPSWSFDRHLIRTQRVSYRASLERDVQGYTILKEGRHALPVSFLLEKRWDFQQSIEKRGGNETAPGAVALGARAARAHGSLRRHAHAAYSRGSEAGGCRQGKTNQAVRCRFSVDFVLTRLGIALQPWVPLRILQVMPATNVHRMLSTGQDLPMSRMPQRESPEISHSTRVRR